MILRQEYPHLLEMLMPRKELQPQGLDWCGLILGGSCVASFWPNRKGVKVVVLIDTWDGPSPSGCLDIIPFHNAIIEKENFEKTRDSLFLAIEPRHYGILMTLCGYRYKDERRFGIQHIPKSFTLTS